MAVGNRHAVRLGSVAARGIGRCLNTAAVAELGSCLFYGKSVINTRYISALVGRLDAGNK